jgi:hypothetical protein
MTTPRDPDAIIAAWLDEGPTDLPSTTRRAILTALPPIPQARRGPFAPWRSLTMTRYSNALLVALVLVAAGGAGYALLGQARPDGVGGAPAPSQVASTPNPEPSVTSTTIDRSVEDGYLMTIPSTWHYRVVPNGLFFSAAAPITSATLYVGGTTEGETPVMYEIREAIGSTGTLKVSGRTIDELLASVDESFIVQTSTEASARRQVTIDGEPGWVTEHATSTPSNLWIDVVVIHGDRAYNLSIDAPPDKGAELRAMVDEILSSIRWTD